jgi:hypothetical protein
MNLSNLIRVMEAYGDKRHKYFTSYYPILFAIIVTSLMPLFAAAIYIAIVVSC